MLGISQKVASGVNQRDIGIHWQKRASFIQWKEGKTGWNCSQICGGITGWNFYEHLLVSNEVFTEETAFPGG